MADLTDFLRARLDEDEQVARSSGDGRVAWLTYLDDEGHMHYTTVASGTDMATGSDDTWVANGKELPAPARVLLVYDPARELRKVEARQRILATFVALDTHPNRLTYGQLQQQWVALRAVIAGLALPYADHPDYREEWRP